MSDVQTAVLPYSEAVKRGVPSYAHLESGDDTHGKELITGMYARSLTSIRTGTALYQQVASKHKPIVSGSIGNKVHVCLCPRNARLPPIETWMVAMSHFTPAGHDRAYYVVDRAKIMLPTTFGNYMQQVELGVWMFSYLQQEFAGSKILYPSMQLERQEISDPNYAISRNAIREVSKGTTKLLLDNNQHQDFYLL